MGFADLVAAADRAAQEMLGGQPVTYLPDAGPSVVVTGLFDEQYVLAEGTAEAGVATSGPAVFLLLDDLPVDPAEDDDATVTIGAVPYRVIGVRPDGIGGVVLALRLKV